MAFKRIIDLIIGVNNEGVLISDLHIEFDITRSTTFEENTAEFVIYNANADTRKYVLKENNNVIFDAGYEDEGTGTIFIGNITKSISKQVGPDWITNVLASTIQTNLTALKNNFISLSFAEKTPVIEPLKRIASAIGLGVYGEQNVSGVVLPNGFTHAGSTRSALVNLKNILKSKDVGLYADNQEIIVYNLSTKSGRFSTVLLDYESGLKNITDITEYDNQGKLKKKKSKKGDVAKAVEKRYEVETILIP
ncbi:MAG: baseplate hub protein, partial [Candidatus Hodarchaeales archaeon]